MRRTLTTMMGITMALLLASVVQAAETKTGTVVSKDMTSDQITIRTEDGERITFRATDDTRFRADGKTIALGDLEVGARVKVSAEPVTSGTRAALTVDVEGAENVANRAAGAVSAGASAVARETREAGDAVADSASNLVNRGERQADEARQDTAQMANEAQREGDRMAVQAERQGERMADRAERQADRMDMAEQRDYREERYASRLPDTATALPVIALLGGIALAVGLVIRKR